MIFQTIPIVVELADNVNGIFHWGWSDTRFGQKSGALAAAKTGFSRPLTNPCYVLRGWCERTSRRAERGKKPVRKRGDYEASPYDQLERYLRENGIGPVDAGAEKEEDLDSRYVFPYGGLGEIAV